MLKNSLMLNDVLLSSVSLASPFIGKDAKIDPVTQKPQGKYHVDGIFATNHPQFSELQAVIRDVAAADWKEKAQQNLEMIKGNNQKFPLQKGDTYRAGKPQYAGKVFLSASNWDQPLIVVSEPGRNITTADMPLMLTPSHPKWPYDGCRANIHIKFGTYTYQNLPGMRCVLLGVQFYEHGTRLRGSSVSAAGEFGILPSAADSAPPAQTMDAGDGLI